MTKLDAINEVLFYINEAYINSLNDMTQEAQDIEELLTSTTREICIDNQPFNILPYALQPDENGIIKIGSEILGIEPESLNNIRVVGKKLYNTKDRTYIFSEPVYADCKILFDFEELEDVIQDFIVKKTIVKKVSVDLGNKDLVQSATYAMDLSNVSYVQYNLRITNYNFNDDEDSNKFHRYYDSID